jgi:hypothetical protein
MSKIKILFFLLGLAITTKNIAQEINHPKKEVAIYTFFVNSVPDQFNFPLIGFVNFAKGSQKSAHIGFVNWNGKNLTGAQIGFVNTIGGNSKGAQAGFVNTCIDSISGAQVGFINTVVKSTEGTQIGYVNTTFESTKGAQIGFVNFTKAFDGVQLGFVNIADTVQNGFPLGFISFVRKGGYKAVELSVTEMYPVNLSFKLGISKLYTKYVASYNPRLENPFAFGLGLGSILPISNSFFFNPEIVSQSTIARRNNRQIQSLTTSLGCNLSSNLSIVAGPSLVFNYSNGDSEFNNPIYSIYSNRISETINCIIGFRFALNYEF